MTDLASRVGVLDEGFLEWISPRRVIVAMGITLVGYMFLCGVLLIGGAG